MTALVLSDPLVLEDLENDLEHGRPWSKEACSALSDMPPVQRHAMLRALRVRVCLRSRCAGAAGASSNEDVDHESTRLAELLHEQFRLAIQEADPNVQRRLHHTYQVPIQ